MALQDLCHLQEVFPDTDCSPFGTRTGYYDGGFPASSSSHLFNFFIPAAEFLQESPLQFGQVSNASTSQDHLLSSLSWPPGLPQDSPQSVPLPFPMSHGTTTLAFLFQGGVLAAADTRSSCSGLVACPSSQKVLPIHSHLVGTTSGTSADCALWKRILARELRLYQLRHGRRLSTGGAAKLMSHMLHPFKGSELCVAATLCGWDGGELDLNQKPTQEEQELVLSSIDTRTGPSDPDSLEKASQSSTDARTGPSDPDSLEKASQSSIDTRTGPSDPDSLEKSSQSSTDARTGPSDPDSLEKASQSSTDARTGPSDPDSLEKASQSSIDARTGPSDPDSLEKASQSSIDTRTGPSDPDSLEKASQSSTDARTGPSDPDSLEKSSQSLIDARTGPSDPDSLEKSSQSSINAQQSFVRKRPSGPSLFYVCSDGTRLQGVLFSVGSGSPYAYSILDQGVRWDLTLQEATSVAREAVYRATHRDAWSGNCVDVFHVSSAGWKRRGREDLREEYYRERERRGGRGPEGGVLQREGQTGGDRT
ncbi:Proteasome subunit beta type-11 [Dissostichus eleginoides]|uniref:Proteasome subunit beta type-11 n=1 Tax=Dissostichus eleginoides TaxID=100907 RepID=A0AAD9FCR0_DISEL|nr:Proteasome subunit beta type-11 [Dissostichus eleginoides]